MINHIVILGGGFAGWYTSAALKHHFPNIKLTVIDSSEVNRLGVGETLGYSSPHDFKNLLGITDDRQLMRSSGAIYKYGVTHRHIMSDDQELYLSKLFNLKIKSLINFYNEFKWTDFCEPWNANPGDVGILSAWASLNKHTNKSYCDFIDEVTEAQHFVKNPLAPYIDGIYALRSAEGWSYHVDAEQTVKFFKELAIKGNHNIVYINKTITDVLLNDDDTVKELVFNDNERISGDIFIDASGFSRTILKKLPGAVWKNSGDEYNNSAWVCPSTYLDPEKEMVGSTQLFGEDYGWRFKLNLYHRMGNGYIFNRHLTNPDLPLQKLLKVTENTRLADPKLISWTPGFYEKSWVGNVIGLGISANFVDPHDAPSFDLHSRSLESLILALKQDNIISAAENFNNSCLLAAKERELRLLFNFGLSKRSGAYWDTRREMIQKNNYMDQFHKIVSNVPLDIESRLKYFWHNMYLRMLISADTDRTQFNFPAVTPQDTDMVNSFFNYNKQRNKYISHQEWPNNYRWLQKNRFDGLSSQEVLEELHPNFCNK